MKCSTCREKDAELLTVWERTRNWLFLRFNHVLFPQDFDDLRSEKYTQGYGDGYIKGTEDHQVTVEKTMKQYGL